MAKIVSLAFLASLVACGGSDSPHDVVACNSASWDPASMPLVALERCERACATKPTETMASCRASSPSAPDAENCTQTFVFDGISGCCKPQLAFGEEERPVLFYVCE